MINLILRWWDAARGVAPPDPPASPSTGGGGSAKWYRPKASPKAPEKLGPSDYEKALEKRRKELEERDREIARLRGEMELLEIHLRTVKEEALLKASLEELEEQLEVDYFLQALREAFPVAEQQQAAEKADKVLTDLAEQQLEQRRRRIQEQNQLLINRRRL